MRKWGTPTTAHWNGSANKSPESIAIGKIAKSNGRQVENLVKRDFGSIFCLRNLNVGEFS
jgi:hypothetical protein